MASKPRGQIRMCAQCGARGAGQFVLTCVRHVYAYQWLCVACAARAAKGQA